MTAFFTEQMQRYEGPREILMRLLATLTMLFVDAFGLTRPRPEQQQKAYLIIGGAMVGAILLALGLIVAMLWWAFHA